MAALKILPDQGIKFSPLVFAHGTEIEVENLGLGSLHRQSKLLNRPLLVMRLESMGDWPIAGIDGCL